MRPSDRTRLDAVALMGALCLFFSTLEYLIPKPLPFFRLGLANLPVLLSLSMFSPADVLLLVALKVIGQGLVNGTLASYVFLFSAAGSIASVAVMLAVHRFGGRWVSLVGVSVLGALASNAVQVALSVTFIASGFVVGLVAQRFRVRSQWLIRMESRYHGT